jgi:hypothetical protein
MKNILLILISFMALTGCASYMKRQSCESTNWFEYGQNVALDGRRLTGDQFILECQRADADLDEADLDRGFKAGLARYCQPEIVLQTGKNGKFFNEEMCTGMGLNNLRVLHRNGVLQYCDRANGYSAGTKGDPYNKICPADLEKAFLPEFNRGRKRYLSAKISQNNNQIQDLNREAGKLQSELTFKKGMRLALEARASGQATADPEGKSELSNLNSDIYQLESSLRSVKNRQESLKEQNRKMELEIVQLD